MISESQSGVNLELGVTALACVTSVCCTRVVVKVRNGEVRRAAAERHARTHARMHSRTHTLRAAACLLLKG